NAAFNRPSPASTPIIGAKLPKITSSTLVNAELFSQNYPDSLYYPLYYLGYSFLEQEELYFIVIGPYLEVIPNIYSLSLQYNLNSHQSSDLRDFIEKINVLTEGQISSYAAVLQQFDSMKEAEAYASVISPNENKVNKPQENAIVDEEANLVKKRYKVEKDFMHAVENGDKKAALKQISSDNMLFSFSERFPNQPLRRLKNLTIILNTLLRIAARKW